MALSSLSNLEAGKPVAWQVRAIRGATTVEENTAAAMRLAVRELMDELTARNQLHPEHVVSAIFSVTADLDAMFPASVARERPGWDAVALLDVQQMAVQGSLERCIRVIIHLNSPLPQREMIHVYLGRAQHLRPDLQRPVVPSLS